MELLRHELKWLLGKQEEVSAVGAAVENEDEDSSEVSAVQPVLCDRQSWAETSACRLEMMYEMNCGRR